MTTRTISTTRSTRTSRPDPGADAPRETGTVRRVLMLLRCLADHPGEPVNATAARMGLPRSTTHRLLAMLRADDFSLQGEDGTFSPGAEFHRIAGRVSAQVPYGRLAQPLLQRLAAEFEETSILPVLSRRQLRMYYAASASPPDPMRYNVELNRLEPLLWGATARVMLAYLSDVEIDTAIAGRAPSPLGVPAPSREDLLPELARIREQGHAVTLSHRTRNAVGIAVPFFDGLGEVVGGFAFLVPAFRYSEGRRQPLVDGLARAAKELSTTLGYAGHVSSSRATGETDRG